ncbi:CDP-alcohol phosphatidyltransferase family protein [Schaalia vaccimaxillae]|uniref:CDP-alcohol phosphatidyltransferase family protein n=1 Tax=Schaalia vaccimaxillae TaxID=183916 RepID=UPI0003B778C9|nr:CDP-alcohol phosphatidyltransferase family protein [Schaalia vaccimaxillae]
METPMCRLIAAWAVHALTLSGVVWALMAAISLAQGDIGWMWVWLGVALVVDGVDGTLARKVGVREAIPWFSGSTVDIAVDYMTWSFLPALFMYWYLPFGSDKVALAMAIIAAVSSLFCYASEYEKSADNYFVGFPAAWNVVAVIMYVLDTPAWINIGATVILAILTLVPLHYTHPFRCVRFRKINLASVAGWIGATAAMVAFYPNKPWWLLAIFWVCGGWFILSGIIRTVVGPDRPTKRPRQSAAGEASANHDVA